jgi:hypothetical protein
MNEDELDPYEQTQIVLKEVRDLLRFQREESWRDKRDKALKMIEDLID